MKKEIPKNEASRASLNLRSIFRCMMEDGYYPTFEKSHILFGLDDNIAVVEYEDGVLSIRVFFHIDKEARGLFLEASNEVMTETLMVKPAVLEDMKSIMFSFETLCFTVRDFRRFFPKGVRLLNDALAMHKLEMHRHILEEKVSSAALSAAEDTYMMSSEGRKPLS